MRVVGHELLVASRDAQDVWNRVARREVGFDAPAADLVLDFDVENGLGALVLEVVVEPLQEVFGPLVADGVGESFLAEAWA
jgi:hypothetical protein